VTLGGLALRPYSVFDLKIRTTKLAGIPYSPYQRQLHSMILEMQDKGCSYNAIADFLNKNSFKTPRGRSFRNAHAHSIIKKKKIRDERLEREYPDAIENFDILFL
jgi:DNA-binding transcriptional MerR regulator